MPFEKIDFRQPRELAELINVTFSFLRQNYLKLGKCLIFLVGPVMLIAAVYSGYSQERMVLDQQTSYFPVFTVTYSLSMILALLASSLLTAVVYHYIKLYVESEDGDFDINDVWQSAKGDVLKFIAASFVFWAIIMVGLIFCIVPGIYLGIAFSLIYVVLTQERLGVFEALSRSRELVTDYWWATLGVTFVLVLVQAVLSLIFYVPTIVVSAMAELHRIEAGGESSRLVLILASVVAVFGGYLLSTISLVGLSFHYHNLVERKEATGLLGEIDEIGS